MSRDEKGQIRSFSYERFTAVLLEGMKMQKKEIDDLKEQVSQMNSTLNKICGNKLELCK